MWNRMQNLELRKQLILMFCISMMMAILIELFYSVNIYVSQKKDTTQSSYEIIRQTDNILSQKIEQVTKVAETVSNNQNVQDCLALQNNISSKNMVERSELVDNITNYCNGIIETSDTILDIAFISRTNSLMTNRSEFNYAIYKMIDFKYDVENCKTGFLTSWISYSTSSSEYRNFAYVLPVYHTAGFYNDRDERLGTCIIWCRQRALNSIVLSTAATQNAIVAILDSEANIVALNYSGTIEELSEPIEKLITQYETTEDKNSIQTLYFLGRKCYVHIKTNERTGWKSINITPIREIYKYILKVLYLGFGLAGLNIVMTLILGLVIIRGITIPVSELINTLKEIGKNNRKLRFKTIWNNEFGMIAQSVNEMLNDMDVMTHRIFGMQAKLYETDLLQKETEIMALQSQINPHFLYNTLECIRSIAIVRKIKEISVITESMANIFRYGTKGGIFTTVKAELDSVIDYYKIISIRYAGRLSINIDVNESLYFCKMLKMSLQPIIENSVNHGLEKTENNVHISLNGWKEGNFTIFTITDNGVGMSETKVNQLNEMFTGDIDVSRGTRSINSIGLANINGRIRLYYGENYGLSVQSNPNVETTVIIKIRLDEEKSEVQILDEK